MPNKIVFITLPNLRPKDLVDPELTPTLCDLIADGATVPLIPSFPCVTSPVQANMVTGRTADAHGIIGNGFYHRDKKSVELWTAFNSIYACPQIWDAFNAQPDGPTAAVLHAQNIKDAAAQFIITPAPIHQPDGTEKMWCYEKPAKLYEEMLADLGPFPLQHYWGPLAGIQSSQWIADAAVWLIERHAPDLTYLYFPHLDYAAQKVGPNAPESQDALKEFDQLLNGFLAGVRATPVGEQTDFVIASEYAITDVVRPIYPNRILREADLLRLDDADGAELLNVGDSPAFAVVDHQFANVYCNTADPAAVADLFRNTPGIQAVLTGRDRAAVHMDHPRAGDVVLIAEPDAWLAYYWWLREGAAPPFARTVDIHRKPGYDPVELFFDPQNKSIPLDATLVKGSHGAPVTAPAQHAAFITTNPDLILPGADIIKDTDIYGILTRHFNISN
jgi:hypothetical protein